MRGSRLSTFKFARGEKNIMTACDLVEQKKLLESGFGSRNLDSCEHNWPRLFVTRKSAGSIRFHKWDIEQSYFKISRIKFNSTVFIAGPIVL